MKDSKEIQQDIQSLQAAINAANESDQVGRFDSVEQQIYDMSVRICDAANKSRAMHAKVGDAMSNQFLNISDMNSQHDLSSDVFQRYSLTNDSLNWSLWMALYNGSWVFRKAIDKPAEDMVSCGFTLSCDQSIDKLMDDYDSLKADLISLCKWGMLFGGAVGVLMLSGLSDDDYGRPIDFKKVKPGATVRMYVTDRWYGLAPDYGRTVTNMKSIDYGKPAYYDVAFANGKTLHVHHSFILRFEGRDAPKLIKNGMLQGWGYAEGCHILNELMFHDKLKASVQSLVDKSLIEIIKMPGMRGIFMGADDANSEQLSKRLTSVTWARNNNAITFLDKDDEYQMNSFGNLGGLADLLSQYRFDIASALGMAGVLYGDQKTGLMGDSKALIRYNETLNGLCEAELRPVLTKLLMLLMKKNGMKGSFTFKFNPVYKIEQDAETIKSISDYSTLLDSLTQKGLMTQSDYARALNDYIKHGSISISFSDALLHVIDKKSDKNEAAPNPQFEGMDESEYESPEEISLSESVPTGEVMPE